MPPAPRTEQLLAAILESGEDAIIGIRLDGSIEIWSRGAERLYGFTAAETMGQPISHLLPLYEIPELETLLAAAREGVLPCYESVERLHKSGSRIRASVRHVRLRDERGEVTGILEIGRGLCRGAREVTAGTQLRILAQQMPVLLWSADQTLRITSSWGTMSPCPAQHQDEATGLTVFQFLQCREADSMTMSHHYAALRGESVHFECKLENRVLDVRLEPLRSPAGELSAALARAWTSPNGNAPKNRFVIRRRMMRSPDWPITASSWTRSSANCGAPNAAAIPSPSCFWI